MDGAFSEKLAMEAMKFLKRRDRTKVEVWTFLKKSADSDQEAENVIAWLEGKGYVNDLRYADYYIREALEKGISQNRIRRSLTEKGVEEAVLQKAFAAYEEETGESLSAMEMEGALFEAERLLQRKGASQKTLRGIASRLAYLGFQEDLIYELVEKLADRYEIF